MSSGGAGRLAAWLALGAVAVVAALALWMARPPEPLPTGIPASEFSAERAMEHVEVLAANSHPPGTVEHRQAAEYIESELRALGLEPRVQEGWVVRGRGSSATAIRVRNVMARLSESGSEPGSEPGAASASRQAVVLLSHYDSVPTGPGAGDDAAGVASTLETLRALKEGPPPVNDIIALITDGEEPGLMGAKLFVEQDPWAADVGLVLNFEARGNRGLVNMFQTSTGNSELVRALAEASPYPFANSLSYEVYRRMPNDTDLTMFLDAGHPGLNFAMIGFHPAYHSELDTAAALSRSSLRHMGSHALALSRHFGARDLAALEGEDAVYFNPLGSWLVVYSQATGKVLGGTALVGLLVLLVWGTRREALSWSGIGSAALACLLAIAASAMALRAVWNLFERFFPQALATPHGEPYASGAVRLAALALVVGLVALTATLFHSRSAAEFLAGCLVVWIGLGAAVAQLVPGAGYLFIWPALAGLVGLAAAIGGLPGTLGGLPGVGETGSGRAEAGRAVAMALGALVAALVFAPVVVLVSEALGVNATVVLGFVMALPLTLVLPLFRLAIPERVGPAAVLLIVGLGVLAWVGFTAAPSAATPAPTSLFYLLDADGPEAWWISYDETPNEWTEQVFPVGTEKGEVPEFLPQPPKASPLSAPAPLVVLPGPTAEMVSDVVEDDVRLLRVKVRSSRGAPFLLLAVDASMATVEAIGVDEELVEVDGNAERITLLLGGLPPEGAVVSIRTFDRQPLALDMIDRTWGLPSIDGATLEARPPHLIGRLHWTNGTLQVRSQAWF